VKTAKCKSSITKVRIYDFNPRSFFSFLPLLLVLTLNLSPAEDGDGSTPTSRRNSLSVAEQYIVSAAICMKARRLSKLTGEDDEKESVTRTGSVSEMITRSNKSTPKRSGEVSGISNEGETIESFLN
jgi:hypothetical protein